MRSGCLLPRQTSCLLLQSKLFHKIFIPLHAVAGQQFLDREITVCNQFYATYRLSGCRQFAVSGTQNQFNIAIRIGLLIVPIQPKRGMDVIHRVKTFVHRGVQFAEVTADAQNRDTIFALCYRKYDPHGYPALKSPRLACSTENMNWDKNLDIAKLRQQGSLFRPIIPAIIIVLPTELHAAIDHVISIVHPDLRESSVLGIIFSAVHRTCRKSVCQCLSVQ